MNTKQQRTILIVDDTQHDRETFRRYLLADQEYTYTILEEESAEQALALCSKLAIDTILLDFLLPEMDGLEFLGELKKVAQGNLPSVVMVTSHGNETVAVKVIKNGAQDYLVKRQITAEVLQLSVHNAIAHTQLQRQLQQSQERERIVTQIAQQVRRSLNLDEVLNTTVTEVRQFLNTDRALIFRLHPDGSGTVVSESVLAECPSILAMNIHDPCFCASYIELYRQGLVTSKTDIYNVEINPCHIELLSRFQVRANLVVPILQGSQLWGLLIAHNCKAPREWQSLEVELLLQLATQVGIAIQQSELYQQVQSELAERKKAQLELQEALHRAEAANHAKSSFLANMSHELRTPLNGILGYAQILTKDSNCTPKQKEAIEVIYQCGNHLLTLINDILDLSKIEAGKLEIHPEDFHFPSFLTWLSQLCHLKATEKSLDFTYLPINPLPTVIHADSKRLRQVLMNLLANALKFTDSGGVTFQVEVISNRSSTIGSKPVNNGRQKMTTDKIRFQVEDTGIGITKEQLAQIFLPFEQVGYSTHHSEGTGLGLSITQKILSLMGSQIFVESTPQMGSKFWFDLEIPTASILVQPTVLTSTANIIGYVGKKQKILIVDDHWDVGELLSTMLAPIGFEIAYADNGQAGLEAALKLQPDLILVDLMMPVMNGYEMTGQLRELPQFQDTVIIAFSASVYQADQQKGLEAGCNDFLGKPVQIEELFNKIQHYLNLDWIYDNFSEIQDIGSHLSSDVELTKEMSIPPKEELLNLYLAANIGDVEGVEQQVIQLLQLNPDYSFFANKILELAADFEYEQITKLIDNFLKSA